MSTRGSEVGYGEPEEGVAISKRQGWARRYWRYVHGRYEILTEGMRVRNKTRWIRKAQRDIRPILKEYAAARKYSYDLFNSPRVKARFFPPKPLVMTKAEERAYYYATEVGRGNYTIAIRQARANQARLRGKLTRMTGVGIAAHMGRDFEKIEGES